MKNIDLIDAFCSNGSTWIDKNYFKSSKVLKNDIRNGIIKKHESFEQTINIISDIQIDLLNMIHQNLPKSDLVYADPPHLINSSGIMKQTYGTLFDDWSEQLDNLVENLNIMCNKYLLFKWNDRDISLNNCIKKFSKYFIPGIRFTDKKSKSESYMIMFIKKEID